MKALIQRVTYAKVLLNGEVYSSIDEGICAFIGISKHDTEAEMRYIANKILGMKIFDNDECRKWKQNVVESKLEVLCVSQFTLYNTWKGNKPDFHNAMSGNEAKLLYEKLIDFLKTQYVPEKIKDGQFGAYMQVALQNDGPVTFEIEAPVNFNNKLFQTDSDVDGKPKRKLVS